MKIAKNRGKNPCKYPKDLKKNGEKFFFLMISIGLPLSEKNFSPFFSQFFSEFGNDNHRLSAFIDLEKNFQSHMEKESEKKYYYYLLLLPQLPLPLYSSLLFIYILYIFNIIRFFWGKIFKILEKREKNFELSSDYHWIKMGKNRKNDRI